MDVTNGSCAVLGAQLSFGHADGRPPQWQKNQQSGDPDHARSWDRHRLVQRTETATAPIPAALQG